MILSPSSPAAAEAVVVDVEGEAAADVVVGEDEIEEEEDKEGGGGGGGAWVWGQGLHGWAASTRCTTWPSTTGGEDKVSSHAISWKGKVGASGSPPS